MPNHRLITRRQTLYLGGLGTLAGIAAVVYAKTNEVDKHIKLLDEPKRNFSISGTDSLKKRAAAKGLIYGAAIKQQELSSDLELFQHVVNECEILVPEWEMKWFVGRYSLRPSPTNFDFQRADWMANFAKSHNLRLRGHTLVWHESLPPWFKETVNRKNAAQVLENHINKVVKRYAGKIHSWDVVNEAIEPQDGRSDGWRISPWLKLLGTNYINLAFHLAAAADPQALLVYNEGGLEYDKPEHEARRTAVLKLLERLRANGTPIHALGIESHLSPGEKDHKFNPQKMRQFMRDVASLGLKIMITELDVTDRRLPQDIKTRDRIIAAVYEDYLSTVLDEPAVTTVINWGLSDRYSWINEFKPRKDRLPARPLPYDAEMQPKLAWNAIARAFDNAPKR